MGLKAAGCAGEVYAVCGVCALCWMCHRYAYGLVYVKTLVWGSLVVRGEYTRYAGYVRYAGCVTDTLMVWFMWKHSYEGHRWCGVSIRGMRGMCAMLDVSQIRLWFESCENTRMRVAGGAGWVYAVCGVCALCWMCHTTFQIISTLPLSTFFHFNTNSTHTHTQPSSIIYHLLKLHSFLVFRLSFHFIILLYR